MIKNTFANCSFHTKKNFNEEILKENINLDKINFNEINFKPLDFETQYNNWKEFSHKPFIGNTIVGVSEEISDGEYIFTRLNIEIEENPDVKKIVKNYIREAFKQNAPKILKILNSQAKKISETPQFYLHLLKAQENSEVI
jgi:hypothetical protein